MRLLEGKNVVITGGGSGVGRAAAVLFAEHGANVVVGDVKDEWMEGTVELVHGANATAVAHHCDVSKEADVEALVARCVSEFGRLDVMYNNAGVATPRPGLKFVDHTQDDWDRLIGINLFGMIYGCKHAVLQFRAQAAAGDGGDPGVIVNTCSVAGMVGFGGVPYGVSKAGGVLLTKSLAMEVAKEGIRINAIAPASLMTNFGRDDAEAFKERTKEEEDLWGSFVPTGRATTAEECAKGALFLASDLSSNTTGAIIPVDGGYLAR